MNTLLLIEVAHGLCHSLRAFQTLVFKWQSILQKIFGKLLNA
jgi:hypothetical protein